MKKIKVKTSKNVLKRINKTKKKYNKPDIRFCYSHDKNISHISWDNQGDLIIDTLKTRQNWIFKKFNPDYVYDWVNGDYNENSNNSTINNYFTRGSQAVCNKFSFYILLKPFHFIPETFLVDNNVDELLKSNHLFPNNFLLKTPTGNLATGITLIKSKEDLIQNVKKDKKYVLQRIIPPKLYNNKKHDIRFYVILSYNISTINVYLFKHGYKRMCVNTYDETYQTIVVNSNKNNEYCSIHCTQYPELNQIIKDMFYGILKLNKKDIYQRGYHLFGVDFVESADDKLWVLECNDCPYIKVSRIKHTVKMLMNGIVNIMEALLLHEEVDDNNLIKVLTI